MNAKPTDVDSYIASSPNEARGTLHELRRMIKSAAPQALEVFGYGMPGYKYQGRPLIYFGVAKNHCALYGPAVDAHREELAAYDASKGTIRFPHDKPPPEALVRALVSERMADIEAASASRKPKRSAAKK